MYCNSTPKYSYTYTIPSSRKNFDQTSNCSTCSTSKDIVTSAFQELVTTNGVTIPQGEYYLKFEDCSTWGAILPRVEQRTGNVPLILESPTEITPPVRGEFVKQIYDNGIVFSIHNGTDWDNCTTSAGTVETAGSLLSTTNGVDVIVNEEYIQFPDGTTWSSAKAYVEMRTGVIPDPLINPTLPAVPIRGDFTKQVYDNGVVFSIFDGTNWDNCQVTTGVVTAATAPFVTTNGVSLETGQFYVSFPNGDTWASLTSEVQIINMNYTGTPVDPTVVANPSQGQLVKQVYNNAVVLSIFDGTNWQNCPILTQCPSIGIEPISEGIRTVAPLNLVDGTAYTLTGTFQTRPLDGDLDIGGAVFVVEYAEEVDIEIRNTLSSNGRTVWSDSTGTVTSINFDVGSENITFTSGPNDPGLILSGNTLSAPNGSAGVGENDAWGVLTAERVRTITFTLGNANEAFGVFATHRSLYVPEGDLCSQVQQLAQTVDEPFLTVTTGTDANSGNATQFERVGRGDRIHFFSGDGTIDVNVTSGSALVDLKLANTDDRRFTEITISNSYVEGSGAAPTTPPPTIESVEGDIHMERYDNALVFFRYDGASWNEGTYVSTEDRKFTHTVVNSEYLEGSNVQPSNPPASSVEGDVHVERYDNALVFFTYDGSTYDMSSVTFVDLQYHPEGGIVNCGNALMNNTNLSQEVFRFTPHYSGDYRIVYEALSINGNVSGGVFAVNFDTTTNIFQTDNTNDLNSSRMKGEVNVNLEEDTVYTFNAFFGGSVDPLENIDIQITIVDNNLHKYIEKNVVNISGKTVDSTNPQIVVIKDWIKEEFYLDPSNPSFEFTQLPLTETNGNMNAFTGAIAPEFAPIRFVNSLPVSILLKSLSVRYGANGYTGSGSVTINGEVFNDNAPVNVNGVYATIVFTPANGVGVELPSGFTFNAGPGSNLGSTIGPFQGPSFINLASASGLFEAGDQGTIELEYIIGSQIEVKRIVRTLDDGSLCLVDKVSNTTTPLTSIPSAWTLCPEDIVSTLSGEHVDNTDPFNPIVRTWVKEECYEEDQIVSSELVNQYTASGNGAVPLFGNRVRFTPDVDILLTSIILRIRDPTLASSNLLLRQFDSGPDLAFSSTEAVSATFSEVTFTFPPGPPTTLTAGTEYQFIAQGNGVEVSLGTGPLDSKVTIDSGETNEIDMIIIGDVMKTVEITVRTYDDNTIFQVDKENNNVQELSQIPSTWRLCTEPEPLILLSPDGTRYQIVVANGGALSTLPV